MADKYVDPLTGTETTGHEWDGIRELNNPLPKWWLYVFYATILFSIVWFILFPAWPSLSGYTQGVLGYSSRERLNAELEEVRQSRSFWMDRFEQSSVEDIAKDPELLNFAMAGGRVIFGDNCAPCHGSGGAGAPGYPILADDEWMWGGSLDAIHQTITYGVRNEHADTRYSEMPAFGADEILEPAQIDAVADYVLSISGQGEAAGGDGETVFAENCVACHGEDARGIPEMGAPNLTDGIWLYGGTKDEIVAQVVKPKHGVMPYWIGRLSDAEIKQAAIYVHSLGGGE
ncbi:MAG: cytochrome-c oxidase, cbb3-type subunit III [Rhodospirillales bacterium]|nr:cytochrome-c oxidase, cbb3-type subunit III [Rhodospirillales bacterium]